MIERYQGLGHGRLLLVMAAGIGLVVSVMAGCAAITERGDRAAERVGQAVHDYCLATGKEDRQALRQRANAAAAPHSVRVNCDE
ncbi:MULTISPECIES: hypothetical protein [Halorhodospira]|uniref:hypothetical protein n=1 Tax=Halorhodospira TaxID=85108 RepID=UPI001912BE48|nr:MULTISPECIES: hypothetical protein [Halorhodospira]MBK5943331.1 hypothetical protein [Halorhodospira halophila]MCG5526856.1 hypothetical protein [Halorhodospira halophila]MCG5542807.1 hypothetical protein [Halorhodospira sp. 9628]